MRWASASAYTINCFELGPKKCFCLKKYFLKKKNFSREIKKIERTFFRRLDALPPKKFDDDLFCKSFEYF